MSSIAAKFGHNEINIDLSCQPQNVDFNGSNQGWLLFYEPENNFFIKPRLCLDVSIFFILILYSYSNFSCQPHILYV